MVGQEAFAAQVLSVNLASAQPYQVVVGGPLIIDVISYLVPDEAALEVETRVALPDGARLERATFGIAASPSENTLVGSVASVRDGEAATVVIDFGGMVTVSGISINDADHDVTSVGRWTGSTWSYLDTDSPTSFDEVTTQKLLVGVSGGGDLANAVRDHGGVWLGAQPTALELVVDGATVWFERQGSAPDLVTRRADGTDDAPGVSGDVEYAIDRTDALREAFARARSVGGQREVSVKLRAATPGTLSLNADVSLLHEHTVTFGTSAHSANVPAPEEGTRSLTLTGPFAAGDLVREVALTLTGSFGPERVEPVDGPPVDDEARLVLGAGRTLLFGIPAPLAALFGELQGVRLLVTSERGGEVAGRLLTARVGPDGRPGEAVAGAQLAPVQVPAGHDDWFTVTLPAPLPVALTEGSPVAAWLEGTSYGEVSCALTTSISADAPGAPVLRRLPGGDTKPISSLRSALDPQEVTTLYACLRVVGLPGRGDPRPAVALSVPGADVTALTDPTGDDLRVVLGLGAGIAPIGGQVPLSLRIGSAGSVTADNVVVAYKKESTP